MEPPQSESPQAEPAPRPVRTTSVIAVVTLVASTVVTGVSIAAADRQPGEQLGGAAAAYVPVDGHLEWVLDDLGVLRMSESARSVGVNHVLQLPTSVAGSVIGALGDDTRTAQLWRESATTVSGGDPDADRPQTTDLHRLSEDGLTLLAGYGGAVGFAYSPALLELPADVAPGRSWSSAGDALPGGLMTYSAQYTASVPSDPELVAASRLTVDELEGCLQTDGGSVYLDESGTTLLDIRETDLWCQGRGRVAIVATVNGTPVVQGPPAEPPTGATGPDAVAAPPAWTDGAAWQAREVTPSHLDPFFGEQSVTPSLASPPRRTASGLVVAADQNGDDLVAFRFESGGLARQWFSHPGGEILTLQTVGEVTVVTTSQRRTLAYAGDGRRLWERETPELVLALPTDAGDGAVVTAGLDGTISSIELLTGDLVWETGLSADVSLPAAVDGERVVVVDRAGAITALDRATGERVWSDDGRGAASAVVGMRGAIGVLGVDGFLRAYGTAGGEHVWATRYQGFLRAIADLGGCMAFVMDELTSCLDLATGVVQWQRAGAQDAVSDGAGLVLFEEATAVLVDGDGAARRQWDIPPLSVSIYRYALAGDDGFWIFRSSQPALVVGRP